LRITPLAQKKISPKDRREKRDKYAELNHRLWRCGHRYQKESDNRCDVYGFFGVYFHLVLFVCVVCKWPNIYSAAIWQCQAYGTPVKTFLTLSINA
jgi:hypothetical protein